jgi:hypothetical protein
VPTLSTENAMTQRAVRRPRHKGVLTPPPLLLYAFFLLLFFPLLQTKPSAADDVVAPNAKRDQAQKGHVFTDEDLVFDTVSMEDSDTAPKLTHHRSISIAADFASDNLSRRFSRFYEPAQVSAEEPRSGYPLPIDEDDIRKLSVELLDEGTGQVFEIRNQCELFEGAQDCREV